MIRYIHFVYFLSLSICVPANSSSRERRIELVRYEILHSASQANSYIGTIRNFFDEYAEGMDTAIIPEMSRFMSAESHQERSRALTCFLKNLKPNASNKTLEEIFRKKMQLHLVFLKKSHYNIREASYFGLGNLIEPLDEEHRNRCFIERHFFNILSYKRLEAKTKVYISALKFLWEPRNGKSFLDEETDDCLSVENVVENNTVIEHIENVLSKVSSIENNNKAKNKEKHYEAFLTHIPQYPDKKHTSHSQTNRPLEEILKDLGIKDDPKETKKSHKNRKNNRKRKDSHRYQECKTVQTKSFSPATEDIQDTKQVSNVSTESITDVSPKPVTNVRLNSPKPDTLIIDEKTKNSGKPLSRYLIKAPEPPAFIRKTILQYFPKGKARLTYHKINDLTKSNHFYINCVTQNTRMTKDYLKR